MIVHDTYISAARHVPVILRSEVAKQCGEELKISHKCLEAITLGDSS